MRNGISISIWLLVAAVPMFARAEGIVWNVDGTAQVLGGDCSPGSVMFMAAGSDMAIVMDPIGVDLSDAFAPLAARASCSLRVPVEISGGIYPGRLTLSFTYGVNKSARSSGELALRASFFGQPGARVRIAFPYGMALDAGAQTESVVSDYAADAERWCAPRSSRRGFFAFNVGMSGQRDSADDAFSVVYPVDGRVFASSSSLTWFRCQTP